MVHISCELFLACVFVSSRDAPTLAITTTDLKPSGYKYRNKTLYEITVIRVPVKVRKTQSLKLRPAAQRP